MKAGLNYIKLENGCWLWIGSKGVKGYGKMCRLEDIKDGLRSVVA